MSEGSSGGRDSRPGEKLPGQALPEGSGQGWRGCAEPLDTAYDVALLDLDGTVYLGGTAVPGAAQALRKASEVFLQTGIPAAA